MSSASAGDIKPISSWDLSMGSVPALDHRDRKYRISLIQSSNSKAGHKATGIDSRRSPSQYPSMNERIFPQSPRETMCGWIHLPRFIDKIRLHLAGKLHSDYQPNFCKGFDGWWLESAGVKAEDFIEVVRKSTTDGEVC